MLQVGLEHQVAARRPVEARRVPQRRLPIPRRSGSSVEGAAAASAICVTLPAGAGRPSRHPARRRRCRPNLIGVADERRPDACASRPRGRAPPLGRRQVEAEVAAGVRHRERRAGERARGDAPGKRRSNAFRAHRCQRPPRALPHASRDQLANHRRQSGEARFSHRSRATSRSIGTRSSPSPMPARHASDRAEGLQQRVAAVRHYHWHLLAPLVADGCACARVRRGASGAGVPGRGAPKSRRSSATLAVRARAGCPWPRATRRA